MDLLFSILILTTSVNIVFYKCRQSRGCGTGAAGFSTNNEVRKNFTPGVQYVHMEGNIALPKDLVLFQSQFDNLCPILICSRRRCGASLEVGPNVCKYHPVEVAP